jgi:hypothetical protein
VCRQKAKEAGVTVEASTTLDVDKPLDDADWRAITVLKRP